MAAAADPYELEIDRLYGLPLADFTPARDELARRLRADGDRAGAELVKRLRKPTVAAWALNQVRRRSRGRVDDLLEAGERLREAQESALSGGESDPLRAAAAQERSLVSELAATAAAELAGAGHPVTAQVQSKLFETLHAAAGDAEARELLRQGRLVRDHQVSDLGLFGGGLPVGDVAPARGGEGGRRKGGRGESGGREPVVPRREVERARTRALEAEQEASAADQRAERARAEAQAAAQARDAAARVRDEAARAAEKAAREAEQAERESDLAQRAVERAAVDAKEARTRALQAAAHLSELEEVPPS